MLLGPNSLAGRLVLFQLAISAVLPPALYYRLDSIVQSSAAEAFTRHVKAYGRALANELEHGDTLASPSRSVLFLDGIVQQEGTMYAALRFDGRMLGSSLAETPDPARLQANDAAFGTSPNAVFAMSLPIRHSDQSGVIYMGFDERPTRAQIQGARYQIIAALAVYTLASFVAAVAFVRLVSRPLTQLRQASRTVARGGPDAHLNVDSRMVEIVDLVRDLESMRAELVAAAERQQAEMQQRESERAARAALENQLRHEQRLATVGTFAGGVVHEFNNILQPLILFTQDALQDIGPEHPAHSSLERAMSAAERAKDVATKMLAFSRPSSDRQPVALQVGKVVAEALDLIGALLPANIELAMDLSAPVGLVHGDATLLSQVVINLCLNAVKAMYDDGGRLTLTVAPRKGSSLPQVAQAVELRVEDTGPGMSPQILQRIFEPFFTTGAAGEGTGLGLSVVQSIVSSMGGAISVCSEPGVGSQFVVTLPSVASPGSELHKTP